MSSIVIDQDMRTKHNCFYFILIFFRKTNIPGGHNVGGWVGAAVGPVTAVHPLAPTGAPVPVGHAAHAVAPAKATNELAAHALHALMPTRF
jgi:hypothetical protein